MNLSKYLFSILIAIISVNAAAVDAKFLQERIDLYDPSRGAYIGSEYTWYDTDGKRLRWVIKDKNDNPTLLFFVTHDAQGRESEAFYFEDGAESPSREVFAYSEDGLTQTTTYYYEPGVPADRTEIDFNERGQEIRKRYFRKDGPQYGEEEVIWDENGNKLGWDFRYVRSGKGVSFRYDYESFDSHGRWMRRARTKDGKPERIEARSLVTASPNSSFATPAKFAPGKVSTGLSETSPSFSRDGKTMVFARYGEDWDTKKPFIATWKDGGWLVEPIERIGAVYNVAISPDANTIIYCTSEGESRTTFRTRRDGTNWSMPENLTKDYGIRGSYNCLTDDGDLFFFDYEGASGAGIYSTSRDGDGFGKPTVLYAPRVAPPFDAYTTDGKVLYVTRCFDEECNSGPQNGIWKISFETTTVSEHKLDNIPYGWGAQRVDSLGIFVFTDGEDILALPLSVTRGGN